MNEPHLPKRVPGYPVTLSAGIDASEEKKGRPFFMYASAWINGKQYAIRRELEECPTQEDADRFMEVAKLAYIRALKEETSKIDSMKKSEMHQIRFDTIDTDTKKVERFTVPSLVHAKAKADGVKIDGEWCRANCTKFEEL